jgi:hypothetical protein
VRRRSCRESLKCQTRLLASDDVNGLSDEDIRILAFERDWWRFRSPKAQSVRRRLGISPTRYHQLLNAIIDRAEALAYDPMLVGRLRRLREARRRIRLDGLRRREL